MTEICLYLETACYDRQAGESFVRFLSQGHNRKTQEGLESRRCYLVCYQYNITTRVRCRPRCCMPGKQKQTNKILLY